MVYQHLYRHVVFGKTHSSGAKFQTILVSLFPQKSLHSDGAALPNPANIVAWKPGWIWPQAFPGHSAGRIRDPISLNKNREGWNSSDPFFFSKNLSLNCEVEALEILFQYLNSTEFICTSSNYCVSPTRTTLRVGRLFPILPTIWKSFTGWSFSSPHWVSSPSETSSAVMCWRCKMLVATQVRYVRRMNFSWETLTLKFTITIWGKDKCPDIQQSETGCCKK